MFEESRHMSNVLDVHAEVAYVGVANPKSRKCDVAARMAD